jgi:NDP-sugar pyrophosphorylase family protein
MQVAILAGGLGTRLGEIARHIPKCMVEVAGRPFLEHQLELLHQQGVRRVVLLVGHLWEPIREQFGTRATCGISLSYSREEARLDTGGALKHAREMLDDEFAVLYGDSYLPFDFAGAAAAFRASDKPAMMTVCRSSMGREPSNVALRDGLVSCYRRQPPLDEGGYIDYGASFFRKEALDLIPDTVFPLADYWQQLIARGELAAFEVTDRYYEIGSPAGLEELDRLLREQQEASLRPPLSPLLPDGAPCHAS